MLCIYFFILHEILNILFLFRLQLLFTKFDEVKNSGALLPTATERTGKSLFEEIFILMGKNFIIYQDGSLNFFKMYFLFSQIY